jgi:AcrR family transcriptional regulator
MRLQRKDWVEAGLRRLAESGVEAVRVEVLARELGATKGSFYWHFKNRPELLAAMLQEWEAETDRIGAESARGATPTQRIDRFVQLIASPEAAAAKAALENAIFAWSYHDPAVARRVAAVEAKRIANATRLLQEIGFEPADAAWWGETGYTTFIGIMSRAARDPSFRRKPHQEFLQRMIEAAASLAKTKKARTRPPRSAKRGESGQAASSRATSDGGDAGR